MEHTKLNYPLWLDWVWTTVLGFFVVALLRGATFLFDAGRRYALPHSTLSVENMLWPLGSGLIISAAQWLALRWEIDRAWHWIIASTIARLITIIPAYLIYDLVFPALAPAYDPVNNQAWLLWNQVCILAVDILSGLIFGIGQAFVLTSHTIRALWWIQITVIGFILAAIVRNVMRLDQPAVLGSVALTGVLPPIFVILIPEDTAAVLTILIHHSLIGLLFGALTGGVLAYILPKPNEDNVEEEEELEPDTDEEVDLTAAQEV